MGEESDDSDMTNKSDQSSSNPEELDVINKLDLNEQDSGPKNGGLKQTYSEAMMNSQLLNSLPKYIFQSNHARLTSVTPFINEIKEQKNLDGSSASFPISNDEVSEYPIEIIENQKHAIERHMSIK